MHGVTGSNPVPPIPKYASGLYPDPYRRSGKGDIYYFTYVDPRTGKRRQRSTKTVKKSEARREIRKIMDALEVYAAPEAAQTFAEYAAPFFLDGQCPRQQRLLTDGSRFGRYHMETLRAGLIHVIGRQAEGRKKAIKPRPFAGLILSEIRRSDIHKLKADLSRNPGGRIGQLAFQAVRMVLSEAVEHEHLERSPADGVKEYSRPATGVKAVKERDAFTLAEYRYLWEHRREIVGSERRGRGWGRGVKGAAPDHRREIVLSLLLALGVRVGELRALRWKHVDLEAGRIDIVEAFKTRETSGEIGPPKWGKIRPGLRIPKPLQDDLAIYHAQMEAASRVYVKPDAFIVCSPDAGSVGATFVAHVWKTVKERTADKIGWSDRWLTPHSCRHTLNTWLLAREAPPLQVQEYLGWQSEAGKALAAMQSHYAHMSIVGTERVAQIVGEILEPEEAPNVLSIGK